MTNRMLSTLALAGAALLFSACSDDDSTGPVPTARPVALFADANVVDFDSTDDGSEASNLMYTLRYLGTPVTLVEESDSAAFATALRRKSALVVPEQEMGDLASTLGTGGLATIRGFVQNGGTLIITPDDGGIALLDSLFGVELTNLGSSVNSLMVLDTAVAKGTPFARSATRLFDNDGTYYVDTTSLPAGAKVFYENGEVTPTAVWSQGRGRVVLVGWDWYDAYPYGRQDSGWLDVLRSALSY